jgi:hypothetical protein
MMEKHSRRNPLRSTKSGDHHPVVARDHMSDNVFEKTKRLRREAMPSPGKAMQGIETQHRFQVGPKFDSQFRRLGSPNAGSNRPFQLLEQALAPMVKVDDMPIEAQ